MLVSSCEGLLLTDNALHAVAVGMGKKVFTLRRNRYNVSAPTSTEVDVLATAEEAHQSFVAWLGSYERKPEDP